MTNYHHQILSELGERLGLSLSFDESGQCCLLLEKFLLASIKSQETGWLFIGQIGHDFSAKETAFWKDLLNLNLALTKKQAGTICYEQESDVLLYLHNLPEEALTADRAHSFLENYFAELEIIKKNLHIL